MLQTISSTISAGLLGGISGHESLRLLLDLGRAAIQEVAPPKGGVWATTRSLKLGFPETDGPLVREMVALAENEFPLVLKAPFEQTNSIAGAVWSAQELLDECRDDGFAKLRFDPGTLDLPMHMHEFSDRFIVVLDGEGLFHISSEPLERFTGERIRSIPVKAGDALTFTRGLMHTFSAAEEGLLLLSYHAPLVELDDPRQYTLPKLIWTPRKLQRICQESQGASKSDVR